MTWETVTFETIYAIPSRNGISVSKNQHDGETKIVNMGELFSTDFIADIPMRRIKVENKQLEKNALSVGDLLFARRSLVASGAGKVSMVEKLNEPTVFESSIIRVRLNQEKALPRFFAYWFRSPQGIDTIARLVTGTNVKGIRGSELKNIRVPLPSLDEQQRITTTLMNYDNLIENNSRQIALLEEAAQRLYKEWFINLRFPDHETTPIDPTTNLPHDWQEKKLSDFAEVIMGQSPKSEFYNQEQEGLLFHQGVGTYTKRFAKTSTYSTATTRVAKSNSILFSVRAPVGRLNITKEDVVIGRGLAGITHKNAFQSFLFYMLKERFFEDNIIGNGSIFSSITKNELLNQSFLIPPATLVKQFEKIASQVDEQIKLLDTQIEQTQEARDRLLPKLMSGELEVK